MSSGVLTSKHVAGYHTGRISFQDTGLFKRPHTLLALRVRILLYIPSNSYKVKAHFIVYVPSYMLRDEDKCTYM